MCRIGIGEVLQDTISINILNQNLVWIIKAIGNDTSWYNKQFLSRIDGSVDIRVRQKATDTDKYQQNPQSEAV